MKSRTMKSLLEKSSTVKLGPLGNKAREPEPVRSIASGDDGKFPLRHGSYEGGREVGKGSDVHSDCDKENVVVAPMRCAAATISI